MTENTINRSLDGMYSTLKETYTLLNKLFKIPDDYFFLLDDLSYAKDTVKKAMEDKENELQEAEQRLDQEKHRVEELGYYLRVLQDFCRSSHIQLPDFLVSGLGRLCKPGYEPDGRQAIEAFSSGEGDSPVWGDLYEETL